MKKLLKGGRVVDPANGHRRRVRRADRRRPHRRGRPRPAGRRRHGRRRFRPGSWCAPASSTCTCTCASRARSTRKPWPPAPRRRWPAASPPWRACRTPRPVNDNANVTALILAKAAAAGLARVYPIGAVSKGSKGELLADIAELQAGRLRGDHRRRPPGGDGAAAAARARIRRHVRHAGDRALRGPDAQGRRRGARGLPRLARSGCAAFPAPARRWASSAACCWPS